MIGFPRMCPWSPISKNFKRAYRAAIFSPRLKIDFFNSIGRKRPSADGACLGPGPQQVWDPTVILWDMMNVVNHDFTKSEWREFMGDPPNRRVCPKLPGLFKWLTGRPG